MGKGAGCADDTSSPEWSESCPEPAGRVLRPPLCSLQPEPAETSALPLPPDTLVMWLRGGTGQWRLCERLGPGTSLWLFASTLPTGPEGSSAPSPPVPSVTAVLGAGKPRCLPSRGSRGQWRFSWHSRPLPAGSPHSPSPSPPSLTPAPAPHPDSRRPPGVLSHSSAHQYSRRSLLPGKAT